MRATFAAKEKVYCKKKKKITFSMVIIYFYLYHVHNTVQAHLSLLLLYACISSFLENFKIHGTILNLLVHFVSQHLY